MLSELFEIGKKWQLECFTEEDDQEEMPFELLVSQICSHTRRIALSTPRIWSSIDIRPSSQRERVKAYVARSASAWLRIRIDMMQTMSSDDEEALDVLLDVICPQSYRWRRLSIVRLFESKDYAVIRRICDCHTPDLRDLSVVVEDIDREEINALVSRLRLPSMFRNTGELCFLRLSGLALHFFRPRLDSIVVLHLDETKQIPMKYNKFREIMLSSPTLMHLSIYGDIVAARTWPRQQNDITMTSLQSLRICGMSSEVYSNILVTIEAPMLESLTLKQLHEHDLDALVEIADVAKFSNLKSLTFWDFDVSIYAYERIMRLFKNVTSFSTFHSALPDSHLVELLLDTSQIARKDVQPLWPMLKLLSFPSNGDDDDIDLAQALRISRNMNGCPVPTIVLCTNAEDGDEVVESEVQGIKVCPSSSPVTWPSDFVEHIQDDIFLH